MVNTDFTFAKAWVVKGIRDSCNSSLQQKLPLLDSFLVKNEIKAINLNSIAARLKFKELDEEETLFADCVS